MRSFERHVWQLGIIELTSFFYYFLLGRRSSVGSCGSTCLPGRVCVASDRMNPNKDKTGEGKRKSKGQHKHFWKTNLSNNPFCPPNSLEEAQGGSFRKDVATPPPLIFLCPFLPLSFWRFHTLISAFFGWRGGVGHKIIGFVFLPPELTSPS